MGKSFAYGAQRGLFLIQGNADARAGIRLSGADMVLGGEPARAAQRPARHARGARQLQGLRVRVHDRRARRRARRPRPVALQRHDRRRGLRAPEPRLGPRRGGRAAAPLEGGQGQHRGRSRRRTPPRRRSCSAAYREALRESGQDETADGARAADRRPGRALRRRSSRSPSRPTRTSPRSSRWRSRPAVAARTTSSAVTGRPGPRSPLRAPRRRGHDRARARDGHRAHRPARLAAPRGGARARAPPWSWRTSARRRAPRSTASPIAAPTTLAAGDRVVTWAPPS